MDSDKEYLVVTDENGNEIECEIIMTFTSDEFGKSYVVYQVNGDEEGKYYAASYDPDDDDEGKLFEIETDEEWDLIEEVLEDFLEKGDEDEDEDNDDDEDDDEDEDEDEDEDNDNDEEDDDEDEDEDR